VYTGKLRAGALTDQLAFIQAVPTNRLWYHIIEALVQMRMNKLRVVDPMLPVLVPNDHSGAFDTVTVAYRASNTYPTCNKCSFTILNYKSQSLCLRYLVHDRINETSHALNAGKKLALAPFAAIYQCSCMCIKMLFLPIQQP